MTTTSAAPVPQPLESDAALDVAALYASLEAVPAERRTVRACWLLAAIRRLAAAEAKLKCPKCKGRGSPSPGDPIFPCLACEGSGDALIAALARAAALADALRGLVESLRDASLTDAEVTAYRQALGVLKGG